MAANRAKLPPGNRIMALLSFEWERTTGISRDSLRGGGSRRSRPRQGGRDCTAGGCGRPTASRTR
jgi:hypothetical protein